MTGGSYYLDLRSFDFDGNSNGSSYVTGTLAAGKTVTHTLTHSSVTQDLINASLKLVDYSIAHRRKDTYKKSRIEMIGKVTPFAGGKVLLSSSFQVMVGGTGGYSLSIPASQFKTIWSDKKKTKVGGYVYLRDQTQILLSPSGGHKSKG